MQGATAAAVAAILPSTPALAATPETRRRIKLAFDWKFALGHAADIDKDFGFGRDQRTYAKTGGSETSPIAEAATELEAARLLTLRAAALKDAGRPYGTASAMAKLFAAETAMRVTTDAIQVHGGYGYIKEYEVERSFRDAKITQIYEGTSQIQKLVIAREVLAAGRRA